MGEVEDKKVPEKAPKNYKKCQVCGLVDSPVRLGQHYKKYPSHRPEKWSPEKKPPHDPDATAFQPGWKGGPGRPVGSRSQHVKDREMVEHFLNVIRLNNGEEVDDSIAQGLFKWADEDSKNMRIFMERVMTLLAERLTPAQMSSDEIELRRMEIEATKQADTGGQGQVINIIAPGLPIPNVNENVLPSSEAKKAKKVENILALPASSVSDSVSDSVSVVKVEQGVHDHDDGWDDFNEDK